MSSCLNLINQQFPHLRDQVACLFESDVVFRELCEDYETCTQALAQQGTSQALRREYAALQLRLETELLQHLQDDANPPGRRK
jgi:hypothetical protein